MVEPGRQRRRRGLGRRLTHADLHGRSPALRHGDPELDLQPHPGPVDRHGLRRRRRRPHPGLPHLGHWSPTSRLHRPAHRDQRQRDCRLHRDHLGPLDRSSSPPPGPSAPATSLARASTPSPVPTVMATERPERGPSPSPSPGRSPKAHPPRARSRRRVGVPTRTSWRAGNSRRRDLRHHRQARARSPSRPAVRSRPRESWPPTPTRCRVPIATARRTPAPGASP